MTGDPLERLRTICLALPEAAEKEAWGTATFRVRDKIFAQFEHNHHRSGRIGVWCKAAPGARDILVGADADRYYVPPYVGPRGWIGARLDLDPDWALIAELIEESYRLTAPKRLLSLLDAG